VAQKAEAGSFVEPTAFERRPWSAGSAHDRDRAPCCRWVFSLWGFCRRHRIGNPQPWSAHPETGAVSSCGWPARRTARSPSWTGRRISSRVSRSPSASTSTP